jgi:hypothetical protein
MSLSQSHSSFKSIPAEVVTNIATFVGSEYQLKKGLAMTSRRYYHMIYRNPQLQQFWCERNICSPGIHEFDDEICLRSSRAIRTINFGNLDKSIKPQFDLYNRIKNKTSLHSVKIWNNPCTNPSDFQRFLEAIQENITIHSLELICFGFRFNREHRMVLSRFIAENTTLRSLSLHSIDFPEDIFTHFIDSLIRNTTLLHFEIYYCYNSISHIIRLIRENRTLQHISIRKFKHLENISKLLNALNANTTLKTLIVSDDDLPCEIKHPRIVINYDDEKEY